MDLPGCGAEVKCFDHLSRLRLFESYCKYVDAICNVNHNELSQAGVVYSVWCRKALQTCDGWLLFVFFVSNI